MMGARRSRVGVRNHLAGLRRLWPPPLGIVLWLSVLVALLYKAGLSDNLSLPALLARTFHRNTPVSVSEGSKPFRYNGQLVIRAGCQVLTLPAVGPLDWLSAGQRVTLILIPPPRATAIATATSPRARATVSRQHLRTPVDEVNVLEDVLILGVGAVDKDGRIPLVVAIPPKYDLTTLGRLSDRTMAHPMYVRPDEAAPVEQDDCTR